MKRLIECTLLGLALAGCARTETPIASQVEFRGALDSSSTRAEMKNEFRALNNKVGNIADKIADIADICGDIDDRVSAFNELLALRQAAIRELSNTRGALLETLFPLQKSLAAFIDDRNQVQGQNAAITKAIKYISSPNTFRTAVVQESRRLRAARRAEFKGYRKALKDQVKAPFPSSTYDMAKARADASKAIISGIEGQLTVLNSTIQQNLNQVLASLQSTQATLNARYQKDVASITELLKNMTPHLNQLRTVQSQIDSVPITDQLTPLALPPLCDTI